MLPAKQSAPSSIATEAMADWSNPDFTITIPGYYTGQYSKYAAKANEFATVLGALKEEARSRGYIITQWMSNETMLEYVHFRRTGPSVVTPQPKLAIEDNPVIKV